LSGYFAYRLGYQGVISSTEQTGVPLNISMIPDFLHKAKSPYKCHALGKWVSLLMAWRDLKLSLSAVARRAIPK
jgi:hypothetical protein